MGLDVEGLTSFALADGVGVMLVGRTARPRRFLERHFAPQHRLFDAPGMVYEGHYLELVDDHGRPALMAWRATRAGYGGIWTRPGIPFQGIHG